MLLTVIISFFVIEYVEMEEDFDYTYEGRHTTN